MDGNVRQINYFPSPTFEDFHRDDTEVRGVGGPINSGKSSGMCMEVFTRAMRQHAYRGVRRSRWAIVRNTYNELKSTTIKTWLDWVPESLGVIKMTSPPTVTVQIPDIGDGTSMHLEVIFLALDREEDEKKLRSLELTGVWINEAQFAQEKILETALSRTARYPKVDTDNNGEPIQGSGCSWSGMILDFNLTDMEHHIYKAFVLEKRPTWKLWLQPPAILEAQDPAFPDDKTKVVWVGNPQAENIKYSAKGYDYYLTKVASMKRSQILVEFCGKWGVSQVGQPVFAETYDDDVHAPEEEPKYDNTLPLYLAIDFGLHPGIVFGQMSRTGTLNILAEIAPSEPSGVSLEELLSDYYRPYVLEHFIGAKNIYGWGDPAGRGRSANDKVSPYMVMKKYGIICQPASTNSFLPRKEAVETFLMKRNGFVLARKCVKLRKGFLGTYGYKKVNGIAKTEPEKTAESHPHDALQYLCLGVLGENKKAAVTTHKGGGTGW
jgi:hypothetical protein